MNMRNKKAMPRQIMRNADNGTRYVSWAVNAIALSISLRTRFFYRPDFFTDQIFRSNATL